MENDAEIFPVHYTWKVAEKGFKRWFLWRINLRWLILVNLFLKNNINFFAKNHSEIQVRTVLVCALYSIKYGKSCKTYLGPILPPGDRIWQLIYPDFIPLLRCIRCFSLSTRWPTLPMQMSLKGCAHRHIMSLWKD